MSENCGFDVFSETYVEARAKFLDAARSRSAKISTFVHPRCKGPGGEDLAIDVCTVEASPASTVLMIVSGTHGVEGYAGSACQTNLLRSSEMTPDALRIVLVHAVNPYGFACDQRTNEDNVDLNRNFIDFSRPLPSNTAYEDLAPAYLPAGLQLEDYLEAKSRLDDEALRRGGYQFLKKALQPGQYAHPDGLYYGGCEATWSNVTFRKICPEAIAGCQRAAVLDIHTGLGPRGVGEVLFLTERAARDCEGAFAPPISCAGGVNSVSSGVQGSLIGTAIASGLEEAICCALEFGTVDIHENMHAMIFENWARQHLREGEALREESRRALRNVYYCNAPDWKRDVIERASDVVRGLCARLSAC